MKALNVRLKTTIGNGKSGEDQRAARRFATGGSPSGCRGRNATRSGCGFFRSSLQAWHRSTLARFSASRFLPRRFVHV